MSNVCQRICSDCPFSTRSLRGFLADYSVQDLVDFQNREASFPCHKLMPDHGLSAEEAHRRVEAGELRLCRGFVESTIKSAKSPRFNQALIEAIKEVRAQGTSEDSMPIWEVVRHHTISKEKETIKR